MRYWAVRSRPHRRRPIRRTAGSALLCAVVLAAAGCGAAQPEAPPPPPPPPVDESLLDLVPAGAQLVLWIDLKQLRGSPAWEVARFAIDDREYDEIRRATGLDPLEVVDEVLISAAQRPTGEDVFVAAVKGRLDSPSTLRKLADAGKGQLEDREGVPVLTGEKIVMLGVTERTVVICTSNVLENALMLATRRGKPLTDDPQFGDLPVKRDTAALMRFRRGAVTPDLGRLGARVPIDNVDKITELDGSLTVGTGLDVAWSFTVEDKLVAKATVRDIRRLTSRMSRNPFVLLIGIDWIFDRIRVSSEGNRIDVQIALDQNDVAQLQRLAERLSRIRQIAEPDEGELELAPREVLPTDRPQAEPEEPSH